MLLEVVLLELQRSDGRRMMVNSWRRMIAKDFIPVRHRSSFPVERNRVVVVGDHRMGLNVVGRRFSRVRIDVMHQRVRLRLLTFLLNRIWYLRLSMVRSRRT